MQTHIKKGETTQHCCFTLFLLRGIFRMLCLLVVFF